MMMMPKHTNLNPRLAFGTSAVVILTTGVAGSLSYFLNGHGVYSVDVMAALLLTATSLPASFISARFSYSVDPDSLKKAMGIFMILTIIFVLGKLLYDKTYKEEEPHLGELQKLKRVTSKATNVLEIIKEELNYLYKNSIVQDLRASAGLFGIGIISGICSGMFGVGGGIIM
jgi:uncharacterized membrane protein YfcA